jgi:hypothetical protein
MRDLSTRVMALCITIGMFAVTARSAAAQNASSQPSSTQGIDPLRPEPTPTEATLGVPLFPTGQFLRSYDAGRGQRFYLFGAAESFAEVVAYYKTVLRQRGFFVFEIPPTHSFEVGRFRAETMNFPPGVTVKDFTNSGSQGYPNPKPGGQPARFPTLIQIIPVPRE